MERQPQSRRFGLDLDSNPDCDIDSIRTENIFYNLAVSGQYIIS